MIFPTGRLIFHISRFLTLKTGDLIYTRTPAGVVQGLSYSYPGGHKLFDFHIR